MPILFCSPPARVGIESGVACAQTRRSEPRAVATRRPKPRRATAGTATARAGRTTRRRTASRSPPCGTCCAGSATRSVVSTERAGVATCPPSNTIASGSALGLCRMVNQTNTKACTQREGLLQRTQAPRSLRCTTTVPYGTRICGRNKKFIHLSHKSAQQKKQRRGSHP